MSTQNELGKIKKFILDNELHIRAKILSKYIYNHEVSIQRARHLRECFNMRYGVTYTQANALNVSRRRKAKKIRKRIELYSTKKKGYFLTLTFTDDVLNNTSEKTRRRYVARYLKANFQEYVANRDYGTITEREHFHGVVHSKTKPLHTWAYGFAKYDAIGKTDTDRKRLANYQAKLTNHALKKSGRLESIIYSRKR